MFKRSLLALIAALCLAFPVTAGTIPYPSNPEPPPATHSEDGTIPYPSVVGDWLGWLTSIF